MNPLLANTDFARDETAKGPAPVQSTGTQPPSAGTFSALEELPSTLLGLFEQAERQSMFLGQPWFQHFVRTALLPEDQVRIFAVTGEESPASFSGMLLMRYTKGSELFPSPRKLSSLTNYYSCFFAPHLTTQNCRASQLLDKLAQEIARDRPRWDAIEINPLDVQAATFVELVEAFKKAGYIVQTFFAFGNWYLPVNGRTFAEYFETLPSVLKNTWTRKKKKLEKSGRSKVEIVTGGPGLETAIDAYTRVYLASWKHPEPHPDFIPGLIRMCAEAGTLRLGILYVDEEPAASQMWIVHNGKALIYKLAYDERFGELSVGTILSARMFEHALDVDKVKEVDYLSGDDAYKRNWMSHRRERWGILALNPRTLRGALAIARHVGGRAAKRMMLSVLTSLRRTQPEELRRREGDVAATKRGAD